jgi:allophanate hydrolase subunit 1
VTYSAAGDSYLLIEYGEMVLDLKLNFFVIALVEGLADRPVDGVVEAAPGSPFDPGQLRPGPGLYLGTTSS